MISERQAAVTEASMGESHRPRQRARRRWPLLWTLSGAVIVSLALWAGIFVIVDALVEVLATGAPAH